MLLEYSLSFDGRSEQFVPLQIKLNGQPYQVEKNELCRRVQDDIKDEQKKAREKLNREFWQTNLSFSDFCDLHSSLLFYSITKEI